jgi:hypothetical protein
MTRLMIYDASEEDRNPFLAASWFWGARLYKARNKLDHYKGVRSLDEMIEYVLKFDSVDELEFWGHGREGAFFIDNKRIGWNNLAERFGDMRNVFHDDSLIWWRTCSTFHGEYGHRFAATAAEVFKCRVAGHTFIIGPWQSGLHSLEPGQDPYWPENEGDKNKSEVRSSAPWHRNTIFCTKADIPSGW